MLEGKAVVCETDMPEGVQGHVLELAYKALDQHEKLLTVNPLHVSSNRGWTKLMARHGTVWREKPLEVALRIYVGVSSSSKWIPWSFSTSRTEETARKALKRPSEFATKVKSVIFIHISSGDTTPLQSLI